MRRSNAQKSIPAGRVALVSLLLAVLWPAGPGGGDASTGAPIGRFVIGVYKPAGWSGGENYDRFFTGTDATNLSSLGINLTMSTPYVKGLTKTSAPDTTQDLEEDILKRFGPYGGYVVEQPSEGEPHGADGKPWPSGLHLLDFAGDPSYLGHTDSLKRANHRNRLGAQVDSLAAKWTMSEYADGFFGYFIGHESDPKGAGGIYDSATYPHLKTVIDSIRNHDTERAIVAVGNAGDTGKWTPGEQTAFRQAFFRPSTDPGPANILMNEQYILSCGSNTDAKVRDRIDRALLPSLNRARTMVDSAHLEGRKAEWYHIVNVNNEYKSSSSCWTQCADGRRQPHYRQPSRAELKAQAHLALARGATGIVYFAYTSKPDTSALACGSPLPLASRWYHGLARFASPGADRAKYAMYDTVKAVNDTLARIGAALYPKRHQPLTWDDNYDNFSKDRLSSSTLIDSARASADSSAAGRLEFGQFHDGSADYVLAVNRDSLVSGGAQTIDLRFDPARTRSGRPVSRVYAVTETATGFGDTLVADASGHVWVSGQRLAPGDGRLYRLRGQAGLWAGPVQGRVAWQDTVRVSGDVTVTAGATLTLAWGTTVLFASRRDDTGGGADPTRSELIIAGALESGRRRHRSCMIL